MSVSMGLKKKVDLPVWEFLQPTPISTGTTVSVCSSKECGDSSRYIYYWGATFYRYDTWTDSWQQLSTSPVVPSGLSEMRYANNYGYPGKVISATNTTLTIGGINCQCFVGENIKITDGTGAGQTRKILSMSENIILDSGTITGAGTSFVTDSTKKWKMNQWVGYLLRVVAIGGGTQYRIIKSNTETSIVVDELVSANAIDAWNNNIFSPTPVTTAGSQSKIYIESTTLTLDSQWTVNPDTTSRFQIMTGGIWAITQAATPGWMNIQYYNVATDTWMTKTAIAGNVTASFATDICFDQCINMSFDSGTATAWSASSITDSGKTWVTDRYANYYVEIYEGLGLGQVRRIVGSTISSLYVYPSWSITPDGTSKYKIIGMSDTIFAGAGNTSTFFKYDIAKDIWSGSHILDYGISSVISILVGGQNPTVCSGGTYISNGIISVNATPTSGGTNYVVGDILTVAGGTSGTVYVESVAQSNGAVTAISLYCPGTGYTTGTGKATSGGTGTSCTISIVSVGKVCSLTNSVSNIKINDSVVISGCTESAYNGVATVLGYNGSQNIYISTTATASMVAANNHSVTVLVDASKNWTINEFAGKLVTIYKNGFAPATTQIRRIVSNTQTTLTLQSSITLPTNGDRYVIHDIDSFGCEKYYKKTEEDGSGWATGGTSSSLIDSTKLWKVNCWAGCKVQIICGTGYGKGDISITGNDNTTLILSSPGFTPDTTTKYKIMDTYGLITSGGTTTMSDSTKKWDVNYLSGKRVRITSGTGVSQEGVIASNTVNSFTLSSALTVGTSTDSTYAILALPARGAGCFFKWGFGVSDVTQKGKYIYSGRGGNLFNMDRYDITKNCWDIGYSVTPMFELLNTGSMESYDGYDRIYITVAGTQRIISFNISKATIDSALSFPIPHSTATIGNYMDISETEDSLPYLYLWQHTGFLGYRTLLMTSRTEWQ